LWRQAAVLAAMLTAGTASPAQTQSDSGLAVQAVRFYRANREGRGPLTTVDVFCRVPLAIVNPIQAGGAGRFRFDVVVRDTAGLVLTRSSKQEPVRAVSLHTRGASTVEQFRFGAQPGRYVVEVTVTDSASGRSVRRQLEVVAFAQPPSASDLLLATDIRASSDADSVLQAGEVQKGGLVLTTTGHPVLTPVAAKLSYYLELYADQAETVTVALRVLTDSGRPVVSVAGGRLPIGAGGGFSQGMLDLTGLPAGNYRLEVVATGPGPEVTRTGSFSMSGLETVQTAAAMLAERAWPAELSEAQLDSAYAPLDYLMTQDERGVYSSLSVDGKRKWLAQFWAKRDPTPGTSVNEARDQFYAAIDFANRKYYEGGASARPGWSTDRGRIFIKMGMPDEVYSRKVSASGNPYEVWRYTKTRLYTYIFMDLTRFGNWTLIYTNDPREASRPGWEALLGSDALRDLEQQD